MTKLTLSVQPDVLRTAKRLAKARKTSVSSMFSQFVKSAASADGTPHKIGPLTRKMTGVLKLPPGKDYKEFLTDALMEKYGLDK
jgi:hypothetical protein